MAILHVSNIPDDLYQDIQDRAAAARRSISAEVVTLLEQAVQRETAPAQESQQTTLYRAWFARQTALPGTQVNTPDEITTLLDRIEERRREIERTVGRLPSSVASIREDRER